MDELLTEVTLIITVSPGKVDALMDAVADLAAQYGEFHGVMSGPMKHDLNDITADKMLARPGKMKMADFGKQALELDAKITAEADRLGVTKQEVINRALALYAIHPQETGL